MSETISLGMIKTSRTELIDISKAWIAISLAFAFILGHASIARGSIENLFSINFVYVFLISLFTAGLGFLLHELAHKFTAQRFGCMAEFRSFDQMLYLAVGLAFFVGFIFAAPGAVMISGRVMRKENGIISLAGPLMNYILAMIFFALSFVLGPAYPAMMAVFQIGFFINIWLGMFNMIPLGNFDGIKIFQWNRWIWTVMAAFGVYFAFVF